MSSNPDLLPPTLSLPWPRIAAIFYGASDMFNVSFDGGTFPLSDVQENPARYVRRLERAKVTPGYATCECVARATPLQLVIRRYGSLLHLAGWPDDGHRHDRNCAFFKDPNASPVTSGGDSTAAIIATPTGLNVRLDAALTLRETETAPVARLRRRHRARADAPQAFWPFSRPCGPKPRSTNGPAPPHGDTGGIAMASSLPKSAPP